MHDEEGLMRLLSPQSGDYSGMLDVPLPQLDLDSRVRNDLAAAGCKTLRDALGANPCSTPFRQPETHVFIEGLLGPAKEHARSAAPASHEATIHREPANKALTREGQDSSSSLSNKKHRRIGGGKSALTIASLKKFGALSTSAQRQQIPVPHSPEALQLVELEKLAAKVLLSEAYGQRPQFLFNCFGALGSAVDDIHAAMSALFVHFQARPMEALEIVRLHFPCCFMVFVARLSSCGDDESLWPALFRSAKFPESAWARNLFKKVFYELVRKANMTAYDDDQDHFYLQYTALLHGGLSEGLWESLWRLTILPFAHGLEEASIDEGITRTLVNAARNPEDLRAEASAFLVSMLNKMPDEALLPLMEHALHAACQVMHCPAGLDGVVEEAGLPDSALLALDRVLRGAAKGPSKQARGVVGLKAATLCLDMDYGVVQAHWDAMSLPASYIGANIEYRVNGKVVERRSVLQGLGMGVVDAIDVDVAPSSRFATEVILSSGQTGDKGVRLTSHKVFHRLRPGTFEFVRSPDGVFRLRRKGERIEDGSEVAYLTAENLTVIPDSGMQPLRESWADEDWEGASIQVFRQSRHAAARIVDVSTGQTVAAWRSDYDVTVDRSRVIGATEDKVDLYGVSQGDLGNSALPTVSVRGVFECENPRDALDVVCECDGVPVFVPTRFAESDDDGVIRTVMLGLDQTPLLPAMVRDGLLTVRHRRDGSLLLRYRFAVVPLSAFFLHDIEVSDGACKACYELRSTSDIVFWDEGFKWDWEADEPYLVEARLDEAAHPMRFACEGKEFSISLHLAAVRLQLPKRFEAPGKNELLTLEELERGFDGRADLVTVAKRRSRWVMVRVGDDTVYAGSPPLSGTVSLNLAPRRELFKPDVLEDATFEIKLVLAFGFDHGREEGKPLAAETVLARCQTGFGLEGLAPQGLGAKYLQWQSPAPRDYALDIWNVPVNRIEDKVRLATLRIRKGDQTVLLPPDVSRVLRQDRALDVTASFTVGAFGFKPGHPVESRFILKRMGA